MVDYFAAAPDAEIDVDIGHGHAFRVEESLEEEVVPQRIDIGNTETVSYQRSGRRATAWSDRNAMIFGVANKIPNDKEIAGVPHALNDFDLMPEPFLVLFEGACEFPSGQFSVPNLSFAGLITITNSLFKVFVSRETSVRRGNWIVREIVDAVRQA